MLALFIIIIKFTTGGGVGGGHVVFDQRNTVASIRDDALGMSEKPDYVTLKGAVTYIRHDNDPWYAACPNAGCNKKVCKLVGQLLVINVLMEVVEGLNQSWTCERCNQEFPKVRIQTVLPSELIQRNISHHQSASDVTYYR